MFILYSSYYVLMLCSVVLEVFPISSSTHMQSLKNFLLHSNFELALMNNIEYCMHGAMFLVLALYFFNRWLVLLRIKRSWKIILKIVYLGFITELMTLLGFFAFWIHDVPFSRSFGFLYTSACLFSLLLVRNNNNVQWNVKNAVVIGGAQALAFLPGVSRFASTFCAARWCGMRVPRALELSFLIEAPILFVVCCKGVHELYATHQLMLLITIPAMLTTLLAMIVMYISFVFVELLIKKERFWLFGFYTLALALLTWV